MSPEVWLHFGVEHRVPFNRQALDLLGEASVLRENTGLVFPSPLKPGEPMSDMTLTKVLHSVGLAERATAHGFRSSFKNWALEQTDTPVGCFRGGTCPHPERNSTEQAYAGSELSSGSDGSAAYSDIEASYTAMSSYPSSERTKASLDAAMPPPQ